MASKGKWKRIKRLQSEIGEDKPSSELKESELKSKRRKRPYGEMEELEAGPSTSTVPEVDTSSASEVHPPAFSGEHVPEVATRSGEQRALVALEQLPFFGEHILEDHGLTVAIRSREQRALAALEQLPFFREDILEGREIEAVPTPSNEIEEVSESLDSSPQETSSSAEAKFRVTQKALISRLVIFLFGFIFGQYPGVIGLVTGDKKFLFDLFEAIYRKKQNTEADNFCKFSNQFILLLVSLPYLVAVISGSIYLIFCSRVRRKRVLQVGSFLLAAGILLHIIVVDKHSVIIARITMGIGLGLCLLVISLHINQYPDHKAQDSLAVLFSCANKIGILAANFSGLYFLKNGAWKSLIGTLLVPTVLLGIFSFFICDIPAELISLRNLIKGGEALVKFGFEGDVSEATNKLLLGLDNGKSLSNQFRSIRASSFRPTLVIVVLSQVFQLLTGATTLSYFGPMLFKYLGFGPDASIYFSMFSSLVGLFSTILLTRIVGKFGRRKVILNSCFIMFSVELIGGVLLSFLAPHGSLTTEITIVVAFLVGVFAFLVSILTGPLGWLSVTFPLESIVLGTFLNTILSLVGTLLAAQFTPFMVCRFRFWVFIVSSIVILLFSFFVYYMVPELAGVPRNEIVEKVWGQHRFWKRFRNSREINTSDIA